MILLQFNFCINTNGAEIFVLISDKIYSWLCDSCVVTFIGSVLHIIWSVMKLTIIEKESVRWIAFKRNEEL